MNLELNYVEKEIVKSPDNIKTFDDIMNSLYLNHEHSFLEIEENIKLPYWKRFGYFYTANAVASTLLFLPTNHTPLIALAMTIPAIGGLLFSLDKKASANIFKIFGFSHKAFRTKAALSEDIEAYKKEVAIPILSVKRNQYILLQHYSKFYEENKYCLSDNTREEIENLKYCFEHAENQQNLYYNALAHIYNLYKKVEYVNKLNETIKT